MSDAPKHRPVAPSAIPTRESRPETLGLRPGEHSARLGRFPDPGGPWWARPGVRRTVIPILLTLTMLLWVVAAVGALSRPTAPLHLSVGWRVALLVSGAACAMLAVLNMLSVRRAILERRPAPD